MQQMHLPLLFLKILFYPFYRVTDNKLEEYLSDSDNKRWSEKAKAGREYALNELNNDKAVESLIQLMKEFIK